MSEEANDLIHLTAEIVSAHVSNNSVAVGDIVNLVQNVHAALAGLSDGAAAEEPAKREPAVSVRSSIKPESITCLLCGSKNKMLKRHLMTAHQMTPADYRAEFGLKNDYPMVAPDYAATRSALAKSIGLGSAENRAKRMAAGPKPKPAPSGRRPGRPKKVAG